ncbi:MAG: DUF456 domain-containing protein [Gemmatimonadetes bacterium]|nr:DUF456 domain-containing protein [Gemmatimonadota bacterium]
METIAGAAASIGQWTGYVVWVLLTVAACATILISLPGGWVALGLAVLYDLFYGFGSIGWQHLAIFAGLLVVAEAIEAVLGTLYVAKKGATTYGMVGGFVGGILGAIAGSNLMPLVGTVLGGFAGAFGGAVAGEYYRDKQLEPSVRIGLHATIGKMLAVGVKFGLAAMGVAWVAVQGVPGR